MRKSMRKWLAILLAFCFAFTMMPEMVVNAAETITVASYVDDGEGNMVYEVTAESAVKNFESVTIPADCKFVILTEVTIGNLTIEEGGRLEIMGAGNLNVTATFDAAPGAIMFLGNHDNIPSCVDAVYDVTEAAVDITGEDGWSWREFFYVDDPEFNGWGTVFFGADYTIMFDGYTEGLVTVNVQKKIEGGEYGAAQALELDEMGYGEYNVDDENVVAVKISVTVTDKKIYYVCQGEDVGENALSDTDSKYGTSSYVIEYDHTLPDEDENFVPHDIHLALNYPKQGSQDTADLISNYLYAYSDLNDSGTSDIEDIKLGLASEWCAKYFWEDGGTIDSGVFDIYSPLDIYDPDFVGNSRITVTADGTVQAKKQDGTTVSINKYKYTVNFGVDEEKHAVKIENGVAYGLTSANQVLISIGSEFYLRDTTTDQVVFYEDSENSENNDVALCIKAEFDAESLKFNGNGCSMGTESINPEGDDVYCVYLRNCDHAEEGGAFIDYFNRYYDGVASIPAAAEMIGCMKLRIVNPAKTFVVVNTEGETKKVLGINSESVDRVSQTGSSTEKKYTEVFVGADAVHIEPVADGIANVSTIKSVALKDSKMADGVKITKVSDDDFKVEFLSNFYDSVPVVITYSDNSNKELIINRVGLVIQYMYLDESGTANYFHGSDMSSQTFNYDYNAGQHVVVYATYYHPTNDATSGSNDLSLFVTFKDGTTKVIPKSNYTAATADTVAMTDFIIDFRQGKEYLDDHHWGANINPSMQSLNAIVLNSGFNDNTSFGGTQIGSGKGVYWDGKIEWNYN